MRFNMLTQNIVHKCLYTHQRWKQVERWATVSIYITDCLPQPRPSRAQYE